MRPLLSQEIARREDFGLLLNRLGLYGTAVEIGVDRADFALSFLDKWQGVKFIGIDPWNPKYDYGVFVGRDRDADYKHSITVLEEFRKRRSFLSPLKIQLCRCPSHEASVLVEDGLDFVYIDGDHRYEAVRDDIRIWWSKLSPNGVLAGHDYNGDWMDHVRTAVTEFAWMIGAQVYYVLGDAASWYILKGEG